MATISTFTKSGKKIAQATGTKLASLGREIDGKVYQHPRIKLNPLSGSRVKVTNPKQAPHVQAQRSASLGMGGVGQRKRHDSAS